MSNLLTNDLAESNVSHITKNIITISPGPVPIWIIFQLLDEVSQREPSCINIAKSFNTSLSTVCYHTALSTSLFFVNIPGLIKTYLPPWQVYQSLNTSRLCQIKFKMTRCGFSSLEPLTSFVKDCFSLLLGLMPSNTLISHSLFCLQTLNPRTQILSFVSSRPWQPLLAGAPLPTP